MQNYNLDILLLPNMFIRITYKILECKLINVCVKKFEFGAKCQTI